ncbi:efflux RND transporter permease subunit [Acidithiobacillus sp.]
MMLSRLIQFALAQRLLILLALLVLVAAGWQAFQNLPIDAYPDVSTTQVKLILKVPGLTPEEVENRITQPVEAEMLGLPRQSMLRSVSKYGLADITVDFTEGTDIYWARQQVAERLSGIFASLPAGTTGGLAPITTPLGEMFMFTVEGGGLSLMERRSLLDWVIRPALRSVPGVADVNVLGGELKSFEVVPDLTRMAATGISMDALMTALASNNRNDGAGRLEEGGEVLLVRAEGRIRNLADLAAIVVANRDGVPVRVGDIAELRIGSITRLGAVTENGRGEAVEGLVLGLRGANARQVVQGVEARLAELRPTLPKGVRIRAFYNRADLVNKAVHTVSKALTEAVVLVLLLLLVFLGNLRAALSAALILPLAALMTFLLMQWFGLSANLMSLGGLAIAIGMLVDAAVVVVENIVQHLAHDPYAGRLPRLHLIYRAVREVATPISVGVLIIITVFLPLLTLQGLEGKLFIPVALTIIFALAASLLLSLTAIPVLSAYLLKKVKHEDPWLLRHVDVLYQRLLNGALGRPAWVVFPAMLLLLAAVFAYTQVGKTFMPQMDEGTVVIGLETLPSISLAANETLNLRIQRAILAQVPEVERIVARTGADEIGLDPMGLNDTDTFLVLRPRERWRVRDKAALIDALRKVLEDFPGVQFRFTQPIEMRVAEMLSGVRGDVAVKIFGPDLATLERLSGQVETVLQGTPGAKDVYTARNEGVQYEEVVIDRLAAGRFGLSVDAIEDALRAYVQGRVAGVVMEGVRRTPLQVRGPEDLRASPADFSRLRLVLPDGQAIALAAVAHLRRADGPVKVEREMGSRYRVVMTQVKGRDLVGFVDEAKQRIAQQVPLPTGYRLNFGGQFENQQRAAKRLAVVVPVALGIIFFLLYLTFRSLRQALLIMSNIPFALVGGIFALWLTGEYLSVPASVGFIALLGIAVLNGVVMVSYFNQLHAQGLVLAEAVRQGARRRLRPVLMTASITAFGLIPLLFASGPGAEIQRPLAIVVIGGLLTATNLTLLILPILYRRFAFGKGEKRHV